MADERLASSPSSASSQPTLPTEDHARARRAQHAATDRLLSLGLLIAVLIGWELLIRVRGLPPLVLPGPILVLREVADELSSGLLWPHLWVTLAEVVLGFVVGSALGVGLGAVVAHSARLGGVLRPYIVASQA